jgi:hypothetical protein
VCTANPVSVHSKGAKIKDMLMIRVTISDLTLGRNTVETLDLSNDILDGGRPPIHSNHTLQAAACCAAML